MEQIQEGGGCNGAVREEEGRLEHTGRCMSGDGRKKEKKNEGN